MPGVEEVTITIPLGQPVVDIEVALFDVALGMTGFYGMAYLISGNNQFGRINLSRAAAGAAVSGASSARDLGRLRPVDKDPILRLVSLHAWGTGCEIDRFGARLTQFLARAHRPVILSCVFDGPSGRSLSGRL